MDVSEIVAACDMKVCRCNPMYNMIEEFSLSQLNELIKICDYSRSKSTLDPGPWSFTWEN